MKKGDQTPNTHWRFSAIIDFVIQVERAVPMATSPSLPTYGITCSHNTRSLFKEIRMFPELPLRDQFPFISPWHKRWTTPHLATWNHTASFSYIPQFPEEGQCLQPAGGHLPAPGCDHPAVLGLMLLQSTSRWAVSGSTSLCCLVLSETLLLLHQHYVRTEVPPQFLLAVPQRIWHWWEENLPSQYFFNKIEQVNKLIN